MFIYCDKVTFGMSMILISIFITIPITYSLAQSSDSIELFSKESAPFGLTYEQAVINYWKTILSLPEDKNPMTDTAAGKCGFELQTENGNFYSNNNCGGLNSRSPWLNSRRSE